MSETLIRDQATDKYQTLTPHNTSYSEGATEAAIVQTLACMGGSSSRLVNYIDVSGTTYTAQNLPKTTWEVEELGQDYVNTSAIFNYPQGTVTENSVISVEYTSQDLSYNSYSTKMSSVACDNNPYTFSGLTSSTYYDCNYVFTQSIVDTCYDDASAVQFVFDLSNSNIKIQHAMQSAWNTSTGQTTLTLVDPKNPLAVTEDVSFNTTEAFGQKGTALNDLSGTSYVAHWSSVDPSDGSILFHAIDSSDQPITYNLFVKDRDMTEVSLSLTDDIGIFRFQQGTFIIDTKLNGNDITDSDLHAIPFFNGDGVTLANNSEKDDSDNLLIPGTMDYDEFATLFNTDVLNTINGEWQFSIDISSSNLGGYTLPSSHVGISDLDNSDLHDNLYYMENYVSNSHHIDITSGTVTIDVSSNGTSTTASEITVDLSAGEILPSGQAGTDGAIRLHIYAPATRHADLSGALVSTVSPQVYYSSDFPNNCISEEEQDNPYFKVLWQKVAQQTSSATDDYLLRNNDATLTLYSSGIVDSSYSSADFDLSFNKTTINTSNIHLWRIDVVDNVILQDDSLYSDPDYTNVVPRISTSGLLTNMSEALTYNNYRLYLTAKSLPDIALYNSVQDVSGWNISYSDATPHLTSSSDNAFTSVRNIPVVPESNSDAIITYINQGNDLSFTYEYKTIGVTSLASGSGSGKLLDYVDVVYTADDASYNKTFIIPQQQITRTNYQTISSTYVEVSDSSYSFSSTVYSRPDYKLVLMTDVNTFDASFPACYGPFDNVTLGLNSIVQTDTYYAVYNTLTQKTESPTALKAVSTTITGLFIMTETIAPSAGNTLSISGTFTSNDLKPMYSVFEGQMLGSATWELLSAGPVDTDMYYNLEITTDVITGVSTADLITSFSYSALDAGNPVVLDQEHYYIPLVLGNTLFSVSSFESSISDLATKTDLSASSFGSNLTYLTVSDDYSATKSTSWTSDYTISATYDNVTQNTLVTVSYSNSSIFTINIKDSTVFLARMIVSYIPNDVYRAERLLGQSSTTNTYQEQFGYTNYSTFGFVSAFDLAGIPGVYGRVVDASNNPVLASQKIIVGTYQSFRVKGDFVGVSHFTATTPTPQELGISTFNNGSLNFQYTSGDYYSSIIKFPYYRGYTRPAQFGLQNYIINRTPTSVKFIVDGSGSYTALEQTLTSNMYIDETFDVDNLINGSSQTCADLGVTGSFTYSIMPNSSNAVYPVTVTGDNVLVTIVNPNYGGSATSITVPANASPVTALGNTYTSTLKQYGQNQTYTFSGLWHLNSELMAIRPSRVKLTNATYTGTSLNYYILYNRTDFTLYKAVGPAGVYDNWLGNPSLHGSQDPDVTPSNSDWDVVREFTAQELRDGIEIGTKVLYQDPNLPEILRLVYFVSVPPYYKFEQISTENCPVIPYNYGTQYTSNITYRYCPYVELDTFNPFASSVTYTDISSTDVNVLSNQTYLNDVTFTLQYLPTLEHFYTDSDDTRVSAIVPGTNMRIDMYLGDYPSTLGGAGHTNPIYNGPITSISSVPDISSRGIIFTSRDASGGINFSMLQYPADIGYASGLPGYQDVFGDVSSNDFYNVNFNIGNPSWYNNNSGVTYFNFNSGGVIPTLYTVVNMNDPLTQTNYRRVYKYMSVASIDLDMSGTSVSGYQTKTLVFSSRDYCDIPISGGTFNLLPSGIWNYTDILHSTVISGSPSWTTDSSFNSNAYVGWSFGNDGTATKMLTDLLYVDQDQRKWTFVTLDNFMSYKNQFGLTVSSVAWDGTVTTPLVKTQAVQLYPQISTPILLNNTTTIEQYSESTLN